MTASYPVLVIHRQLRWEVSNRGIVRPRVDWLCTKERALDHAFEIAREVGTDVVAVENTYGVVTEIVAVPRQLARAV